MPNVLDHQQTMSTSLMASLSHHLPTLLFTSLLYTSINANSVQPSNTACHGITISYPFWHQNNQFEYCGYAGFNLSCAGKAPTLRLSGNMYLVKTINYSEKTITLAYVELNEGICPRVSHDLTVLTSSSLFNYTVDNNLLRFFYNCTLYPPTLPFIQCLQYGDKRSYVFMVGSIPEFDWDGYCESIVTVPVIDQKAIDGVMVHGFGRAMQDGFKLTWRRPDSACQSCEATGGFCGYSRSLLGQNFFCLCTDGRRSANCHETGVVSINFERNVVAMGALIFGGLIIAATIFYFIQRERFSLHKPVFSQIPSSGIAP